ncbi:acireductone synthase [Lyngbya confervoides]|uniref:Enolase-phosphatase E1 n=1 Tax=Lyngbya confervoides BDU141951 TaxID=1574623 RepID=A0ABD4T2T9_9CYAN|nr:acireductone synthase [Lyngbya confervoides]MCM1982706.1 acireductone synthase [Lyngbya confervoides BDU141951]
MNRHFQDPGVQAILLDIEGTVAPVEFVYGVLFPFAREHLRSYLQDAAQAAAVRSDLQDLYQEYRAEQPQNPRLPDWSGDTLEGAIAYVEFLMDCDRKSPGLKSLQGKIWTQGYQAGTLQSQLFPDVVPALFRWREQGKQIFIFSSGSVQAQQLIFRYAEQGDLTAHIRGYFDTKTGPKKEASSYRAIAAAIGNPPETLLFISDVEAELEAAQAAGLKVLLSVRPGNEPILNPTFRTLTSLDQVF